MKIIESPVDIWFIHDDERVGISWNKYTHKWSLASSPLKSTGRMTSAPGLPLAETRSKAISIAKELFGADNE